MTQAVARGWSRWGKQIFNDQGRYGCHTMGRSGTSAQGGSMAENEHPTGALLFILIFLVLVVLFWINTYMRLWLRY